MDETTTKIIENTRKALSDCTEKLCNQITSQTDEAEIDKTIRVLIAAINVCERLQGLENGNHKNPHISGTSNY